MPFISIIYYHPKYNNYLTCWNNCQGEKIGKSGEVEDWFLIDCDNHSSRCIGQDKVRKNNKHSGGGGGLFPGCVEEEEVLISILIWSVKISVMVS